MKPYRNLARSQKVAASANTKNLLHHCYPVMASSQSTPFLMPIIILSLIFCRTDNNQSFRVSNGLRITNSMALFFDHTEKHWYKLRLSPKQILKSATSENAKIFRLLDLIMTIEGGKRANILLLDQDRWKTVSAYDQISHSIFRWNMVLRNELIASRLNKP